MHLEDTGMKTTVYILAGFLGAGKTTVLRNIISSLDDASDCIAIVNEAGALGLDGKLVERAGLPVLELRNGCVCCSLQVDFISLLDNIFDDSPPKMIFMEASGLADVNKLVKAVDRFSAFIEFAKTIVLLDTAVWEIREAMGDFFYSQLAAADLLILNKIDLYPDETINGFISEIGQILPDVNLTSCSYGCVDPAHILAPPEYRRIRPHLIDSAPLLSYKTFSFCTDGTVLSSAWDNFIRSYGGSYERIKGQLALETGPVYFDYVRGRASHQEPLAGINGSRLVFIGQNIDEESLEIQLNKIFSCGEAAV